MHNEHYEELELTKKQVARLSFNFDPFATLLLKPLQPRLRESIPFLRPIDG